jgi:hypothetical protein
MEKPVLPFAFCALPFALLFPSAYLPICPPARAFVLFLLIAEN